MVIESVYGLSEWPPVESKMYPYHFFDAGKWHALSIASRSPVLH
jgi:hypothetical protein